MATQEDVRRLALALPGVTEGTDRFAFSVANKGKEKGIAWVWLERIHPKKARIPNPDVLAIRVADLQEKEALLATDSKKFFTEPHYNGYPAILVRLAEIEVGELAELIEDAWRCQASQSLVRSFDAETQAAQAAAEPDGRPLGSPCIGYSAG